MACNSKPPLTISMLTTRSFGFFFPPPHESLSFSLSLSLGLKTGQVSRSALKQPRSCNIFKALFCCFQAQDGPKQPSPPPLPPLLPPPSQQALLDSQENGTVVKVTLFLFQRYFTPLKTIWRPQLSSVLPFLYFCLFKILLPCRTHTHTHSLP